MSLVVLSLVLMGCATTEPQRPEERAVIGAQTQDTVSLFKQKDPSIDRFFTQSYGYAVFPKIFKAAFIGGGATGRGEVYEQGQFVGYARLSQASVGFSFGGEYWREIIFFRDKADLDKFKNEETTFAAQATGVAISEGVAAKADYKDGMAVFIMADKGLMADASLGGQKFNFVPVNR